MKKVELGNVGVQRRLDGLWKAHTRNIQDTVAVLT